MFSTDVLLNIPTESVAVRAIVASVVGLVLVRLLLRDAVRQPRARAAAVLVPTVALLGVVIASWGRIELPSLMIASEADNALAVPFGNDYLRLAPVTWPAAVGLWTAIAGLGVALRVRRVLATRRRAERLFTLRGTDSPRLSATVDRVATLLRVPTPPVAACDDVPGGATVVGVRGPVLLVDRHLLESLDDEELEGLVAHELAHIKRRDNLVSLLAGICRDLAFFVPGGRWVIRQLHHEREAAADALAVEVTGRPGALASGLLKAIETRQPRLAGAAALAPTGTLEARVRRLCTDDADGTSWRLLGESGAILGAIAASVSLAVAAPAWVAEGGDQPRDVLALLWSAQVAQPAVEPVVEPAAFSVYRSTGFEGPITLTVEEVSLRDDGRDLNPHLLRVDPIDGRSPAERVGWTIEQRSLGLTPAPSLTLDVQLLEEWRATSLWQVDEGLGLYWLSRGHR